MIRNLLFMVGIASIFSFTISKPTTTNEDAANNYRAQYAAQMMSFMNHSVQPCDDFYEYACGNWKNTIKEKQTSRQRLNLFEIDYKLDDIVDDILQQSDINDIAPEYAHEFELAKKFYHNCLETEIYPMQKSEHYLSIVQNIGGFPAVDTKWNASQFSWFNMSAHMNNYGVDSFIHEEISSEYPFLPLFPLPTFGFDIELHYDNIANASSNCYQTNRKRMHDILHLYDVDEDKIEDILKDIFTFLKSVLDMVNTFEESQVKCEEISKDLTSSDELAIYEQFTAYIDIVWMRKFDKVPANNMPCLYFYHELNKICDKHKEAVANYLSLKFLYHMDDGVQKPSFHKDYCKKEIRNAMNFFFDHLFMKKYFNTEIANDVRTMSNEIRESMRKIFRDADWLDETTREAALLKESLLKINIGRYEDNETQTLLLGELKNLKFVENDYQTNRANLKKFKSSMTRYQSLHPEIFNEQTKPLDCLRAMVANAFYYILDNTMYIAAGVLQPPIYHNDWSYPLKYSTLGFTIGHEIGHGFDSLGRNYDHEGKIIKWWSEESEQKYEERSQCFVDHFNSYKVPEINRNINGELTKAENLADATGLAAAYMAFKRFEEDKSNNIDSFPNGGRMPGLDLSNDQLFFLGAAQIWCADYSEAHYWTQLSDSHTIDKYRVLGMISNNVDFAKSFNCPLGQNMHLSEDKCRLW